LQSNPQLELSHTSKLWGRESGPHEKLNTAANVKSRKHYDTVKSNRLIHGEGGKAAAGKVLLKVDKHEIFRIFFGLNQNLTV
jgi:hypothetical protein